VLLFLFATLSSSTFSNWDHLDLPITLIYDFVLIENGEVLLVVEGFQGNATRIVAVDLTGEKMAILSIEQHFCPDLEGNSYEASEFLSINNTAVALHCQYVSPGFIPWSSVYILTWNRIMNYHCITSIWIIQTWMVIYNAFSILFLPIA